MLGREPFLEVRDSLVPGLARFSAASTRLYLPTFWPYTIFAFDECKFGVEDDAGKKTGLALGSPVTSPAGFERAKLVRRPPNGKVDEVGKG